MGLNLASLIDNSCRLFPDAVALIHDERRLTYRELRRNVGAVAAHLAKLGVRPGDRVALFLPNRMSFTVAYFGILQAGGVVVPISYLSVGREVSYALRDSGASLLIAWSAFEVAAREGVRGAVAQGPAAAAEGPATGPGILLEDESRGPLTVVDGPPIDSGAWQEEFQSNPDDTAVILYTSGTTGEPKGAELTHFNLFSNAQYCSERLLWRPGRAEFLGPGQVGLAALPLFHSFGQTCIQNACLLGGAAVSYLERFEPQAALRVMTRDRVTMFAGVPTMYVQLLRSSGADGHDLSALRFCNSGGAAMPVEVMREFDARFGVNVLEGYGLSETSPVATFNVLWRPKKVGSIGLPILGVDVRVFDPDDRELPTGEVGELVIRGYNVCKGYWRRPEATREAMRRGWFHTGDLGRKDEDGYLFIVDRKKDMIIRGGYNVYPREIEDVLRQHPGVRDVAVAGLASAEWGETVGAWVVISEDNLDESELLSFAADRLAAFKCPRVIVFVDELPRNALGKVLKQQLPAPA